MSINNQFDSHFQKISSIFHENLEFPGLLPIDYEGESGHKHYTKEILEEKLFKIRANMFTVAICGGVKAGKSTLLNALLFEDSVLPTFDTPETAKLTFIRKTTNNNHFIVNFYSSDEWSKIKGLYSKPGSKFDDYLRFSASQGVMPAKYIGKAHEYIEGFEKLSQYVSTPKSHDSHSGIFTPFVKSVELYVNHPNIPQNIQIVDTPGLDDPNPINSLETTNWISNAHAILYVVPVRGFCAADQDFFNEFMNYRSVSARIIVQNKIDSDDDWLAARNSMSNLKNETWYKERDLFGPNESICSYSGLIALSRIKHKNNINLNEDEEYCLSNTPDGFNHDPDHLANVLSSKLFSNEGQRRIETAKALLLDVFATRSAILEAEIDTLKTKHNIYLFDTKRIEETILQIRILRRKALERIQELRIEINNKRTRLNRGINTSITDFMNNCIGKIDDIVPEDIDKLATPSHVKFYLNKVIAEEWNPLFNGIETKHLENYIREIHTDVSLFIQWIKSELDITIEGFKLHLIAVEFERSRISDVEFTINKALNEIWFFFITRNKKLRALVKTKVQDTVENLVEDLNKKIPVCYQESINSRVDNFFTLIQDKLHEVERELEDALNKQDEKANELISIESKLVDTKNKLDIFQHKIVEIKHRAHFT